MWYNDVYRILSSSIYGYWELKKEEIEDAYSIAQKSFQEKPNDNSNKADLAWSLIYLCSFYISENNYRKAIYYFKQLDSICYNINNENIIENKTIIINILDYHHPKIILANNYSINGNHEAAMDVFSVGSKIYPIGELHEETYGWIILRYLKCYFKEKEEAETEFYLEEYLKMNNYRPSKLHSEILGFACDYSGFCIDFNLYNFFYKWNPKTFRKVDILDGESNNVIVPSLVTRVITEIANKNIEYDIDYLTEKIDMFRFEGVGVGMNDIRKGDTDNIFVLDILRKSYVDKINSAYSNNKLDDLHKTFEEYNHRFANRSNSFVHSEILALAEKYITKDESLFVKFFKEWNPDFLLYNDWTLNSIRETNVENPLAIRCLKKSSNYLKTICVNKKDIEWILKLYDNAIIKYPKDITLKREKALLYLIAGDFESALKINVSIILSVGFKGILDNDINEIEKNNDIRIGLLCKGIKLTNNEDLLGIIRIELAKTLIRENLLENAIVELALIKKHWDKRNWRLPEVFYNLSGRVANSKTELKNNNSLYRKYLDVIDKYIYGKLVWQKFILTDILNKGEVDEKYKFKNDDGVIFFARAKDFRVLRNARVGDIYKAKIFSRGDEYDETTKKWQLNVSVHPKYHYYPILLKKT